MTHPVRSSELAPLVSMFECQHKEKFIRRHYTHEVINGRALLLSNTLIKQRLRQDDPADSISQQSDYMEK
jgi:hypothetical protein